MRNRIIFILPILQFIIAMVTLYRIENPPIMSCRIDMNRNFMMCTQLKM